MAITKEDIYAAADALVAEGKNPTLANVRKALGGGSFTTISEGVAAWKEDRTAQPAPLQEPPPAAVADKFSGLLAEVWAAALGMANARLASEREALEAARVELEDERRQAAELAAQVSADLDQANQVRERLASELDAAVAAGIEQGEQLATVTKELAEAQQRMALAEQSAKDNAHRADDLARALEAEQANAKALAERADQAQAEAANVRADASRAAAEADQARAELRDSLASVRAELEASRAQAERADQARAEAIRAAAEADQARAEVRGTLAAVTAELERERERTRALEDRVHGQIGELAALGLEKQRLEEALNRAGVPQKSETEGKAAPKGRK
nr:DNA-binding protein [uncultured Roseateles sp.]